MGSRLLLVAFVVVVVACGFAIGMLNGPGDWAWYGQLRKPFFNPPSWLFGPIWTVLYILIGFTGWMVWCKACDTTLAMLWTVQLIFNYAWSPVFFIGHDIGLALFVIVMLLLAILAFIAVALRRRRGVEATIFSVYAIWVAFATSLNAAIYTLNMG